MGFFGKKEFIDCNAVCDEAERRECDECLLQMKCEEVYKNTDHKECWVCRYKNSEGKCELQTVDLQQECAKPTFPKKPRKLKYIILEKFLNVCLILLGLLLVFQFAMGEGFMEVVAPIAPIMLFGLCARTKVKGL